MHISTATGGPPAAGEPATTRPDEPGISRRAGATLLAGGVLTFLGGNLHPRADTDHAEVDAALAEMLDSGMWTASHLLGLIGIALIGGALALFVRTQRAARDGLVRTATSVAIAGAVLGVIELIPHTLAAGERDELVSGGSTPLLDIHLVLQAFVTPLLGLSVAFLAVVEARTSPRWTSAVAALAVVGGVAYALAGPLIVLTDDPSVSPLFAGAVGLSVWAIVTGARLLRDGRPVVA